MYIPVRAILMDLLLTNREWQIELSFGEMGYTFSTVRLGIAAIR